MDDLETLPVDPAWRYYDLWKMAFDAKEKIESIIKYMAVIEEANDFTDERLRQKFCELAEFCEQCSNEASGDEEMVIDDLDETD
ncbi:hypothetical protein IQ247_18095 [Plectonema cf. radiosum LEGE 06105]|uniref:Uncharacterized protein n=1 Tax=Plectonema cf. radiosum LEGE 06105 TaxID=945769 RepID=A0A8J7FIV6_9CYAN|nr:hypothetical protein [Plectonema radiosum]MBE9214556.1 hypothetical protein [Plectonema cf. radiosum LEGE 06105]